MLLVVVGEPDELIWASAATGSLGGVAAEEWSSSRGASADLR